MRLLSILLAAIVALAAFQGGIALAEQDALSAAMEVTETHGLAPLTIELEDISTGNVTGWEWSFGDGSANETGRYATHTYAVPGEYTVILTVTDGIRTDSTWELITVDPSLFVDFATDQASGLSTLDVQFYDLTMGEPSGWEWSFGDGSANSTEPDPLHRFPSAGTFIVTLTVTDGAQYASMSQAVEVAGGSAPVQGPGTPTATPAPALPAILVMLTLIAATGLALIGRRYRK